VDIALQGGALDGQAEARDAGFQQLEPDGFPALDEGPDGFAAHGRVKIRHGGGLVKAILGREGAARDRFLEAEPFFMVK
jgi:hypothetical protein